MKEVKDAGGTITHNYTLIPAFAYAPPSFLSPLSPNIPMAYTSRIWDLWDEIALLIWVTMSASPSPRTTSRLSPITIAWSLWNRTGRLGLSRRGRGAARVGCNSDQESIGGVLLALDAFTLHFAFLLV